MSRRHLRWGAALLAPALLATALARLALLPERPIPMSAAGSAPAMFFTAADRLQHMRGAEVRPIWMGPDSFVYKLADGAGARFIAVDAATAAAAPAFDHEAIAANLTVTLGRPVEPGKLPFEQFDFTEDRTAIRAVIDGGIRTCGLAPGAPCSAAAPNIVDGAPGVLSPDGRWLAYLKGGNLWLRPTEGGDDVALTSDAVADYGYAGSTGVNCSPVTIAMRDYHATAASIASPYAIIVLINAAIGFTLSTVLIGRLIPRFGGGFPMVALAIASTLAIFGSILLATATSLNQIYLYFSVLSIMLSVASMVSPTVLQNMTLPHLRARMFALIGIAQLVAGGLGTVAGGVASDTLKSIGVTQSLLIGGNMVSAVCSVFAAIVFWRTRNAYLRLAEEIAQ